MESHIKLLQHGLQAGERQALAAGAPERPGAQRLGQLGQPGSFDEVRGNAGAQKVCWLGQPLACESQVQANTTCMSGTSSSGSCFCTGAEAHHMLASCIYNWGYFRVWK